MNYGEKAMPDVGECSQPEKGASRLAPWNHPSMTEDEVKRLDPLCGMKEYLGAFIFNSSKNKVIFASDGRELTGRSNDNYWQRYMAGESSYDLYKDILVKLKL
jgi:hypothetical protein